MDRQQLEELQEGGGRLARAGLHVAVLARLGQEVSTQEILTEYRKFLFEEGVARNAGEDGTLARKGFSEEAVEEVLKAGGKVALYDALRCRVRYFCHGLVFGTKAFVEDYFETNRTHFPTARKGGARPLRYVQMPELYTLRNLR